MVTFPVRESLRVSKRASGCMYRRPITSFFFFCFFFVSTAHPFPGRFLSHGNEQTGTRIREFRCIVPDHPHKRINYAIEAGLRGYYLLVSVDMQNGSNAFVTAD